MEMYMPMIGGVVRAVLAAVGGVMVAKGYTTDAEWATWLGAMTVGMTGAWSMWQKYSAAK